MGSLANTQRLTRFVYPVLDVYIRETFGSEGVLCGQVQIWGVAFGYKGDLGSALFAYGGELPAGNSFMTGSGGEIRIWGGWAVVKFGYGGDEPHQIQMWWFDPHQIRMWCGLSPPNPNAVWFIPI